MRDERHTQTGWGQPENDPFEQKLEFALAKYAAVEPRTGLEDRVLANLRTTPVSTLVWWRWGMAAGLATVLVAAGLVWRGGKPSPAITTNHPSTVILSPNKPAPEIGKHNDNHKGARAQRRGQRGAEREVRFQIAAEKEPKLDRFPSPQRLSEQEKILESYVAKYPERAVLLARLRTEQLRQDQMEQTQELPSSNAGRDSETE